MLVAAAVSVDMLLAMLMVRDIQSAEYNATMKIRKEAADRRRREDSDRARTQADPPRDWMAENLEEAADRINAAEPFTGEPSPPT